MPVLVIALFVGCSTNPVESNETGAGPDLLKMPTYVFPTESMKIVATGDYIKELYLNGKTLEYYGYESFWQKASIYDATFKKGSNVIAVSVKNVKYGGAFGHYLSDSIFISQKIEDITPETVFVSKKLIKN